MSLIDVSDAVDEVHRVAGPGFRAVFLPTKPPHFVDDYQLANAGRIVGESTTGRTWVRETLTGPSPCIHLNDTLRRLEDLPGLLALLSAPPSGKGER